MHQTVCLRNEYDCRAAIAVPLVGFFEETDDSEGCHEQTDSREQVNSTRR
jgi:hypothetical protein